jgi:hypothetical protein
MAHWYQQRCGFDPDTGSRVFADRDSPVLALGPSGTVKTSGIIIPAILTAYGGFFYDSTRSDGFLAAVLTVAGQVIPQGCWSRNSPGRACVVRSTR